MDARTRRTVLRLGSTILLLIIAVLIVQFVQNIEIRTLAIGLASVAVLSLEQWLKNSGESAAPSVGAVNAALETNSIVPEPKVKIHADRNGAVVESSDVPGTDA